MIRSRSESQPRNFLNLNEDFQSPPIRPSRFRIGLGDFHGIATVFSEMPLTIVVTYFLHSTKRIHDIYFINDWIFLLSISMFYSIPLDTFL